MGQEVTSEKEGPQHIQWEGPGTWKIPHFANKDTISPQQGNPKILRMWSACTPGVSRESLGWGLSVTSEGKGF